MHYLNPFVWHFCGILFIIALTTVQVRMSYHRATFLMVLFNLSGVVLHEVCHLVVGWVLGAKPVSFSIIPRKTDDGWVLGSVGFGRLNVFNSLPTAMAPLGLIWGAYFVYVNWFLWFSQTVVTVLGFYLVLYVLVYNALPSKKDWQTALNPLGLLIYAGPGLCILLLDRIFK